MSLTRAVVDGDGGPLGAVLQLGVHADLVLRVGLQVVETVSVGSSAQLHLLLLTVCADKQQLVTASRSPPFALTRPHQAARMQQYLKTVRRFKQPEA